MEIHLKYCTIALDYCIKINSTVDRNRVVILK